MELRLDPENAAASIAARVKTIQQCATYIRETVTRYDGLTAFERELERHGVKDFVDSLRPPPSPPEAEPSGERD